MRRALAAAAVLAAVGCKQEPVAPAPTPVAEWVEQSPDGRFEVRQRREAGGCQVQAVAKSGDGEKTLWASQLCLPTASGLVFLSPNGERLLVLDLFPASQAAQSPDWSHIPLISLWGRGAVIREYTGAEVLLPARVTDMRKVLSWVRGDTFDDARRAVRPATDGSEVAIDLVDGRTLSVGFEGDPLPTPAAEPARPTRGAAASDSAPLPARAAAETAPPKAKTPDPIAADERGLYRWEDDEGELHFGAGSQIPAKYLKRARLVDASVGIVPMDSPLPVAAPPPPPPGAPGVAGAAPGAPAAPSVSPPRPAGNPAGTAPPAANAFGGGEPAAEQRQ